MWRTVLAACAWLAAGSSLADDAGDLTACLDARRGDDAAILFSACVGHVTDRCLAGTSQTTLDIAECLQREEAAWDALLNHSWATLRDESKAAGTFDTLLTAQRAWLAFRDAECAHRYAVFGGGSMRVIAAGFCARDHTARRAIDFHRDLVR